MTIAGVMRTWLLRRHTYGLNWRGCGSRLIELSLFTLTCDRAYQGNNKTGLRKRKNIQNASLRCVLWQVGHRLDEA